MYHYPCGCCDEPEGPTLSEVLHKAAFEVNRIQVLEALGWSKRTDFQPYHPTGQEILDEIRRLSKVAVSG